MMPYGRGGLLRTVLARARPWQRYLIAVAMVVGGAALAAVGHLGGALLSVAGIVLLERMVRYRIRRRRTAHQPAADETQER